MFLLWDCQAVPAPKTRRFQDTFFFFNHKFFRGISRGISSGKHGSALGLPEVMKKLYPVKK
jgi:hypothetical protein